MKMNEQSKKALLELKQRLSKSFPNNFVSIRFTGSSLGYKENPHDIDVQLFFERPLSNRADDKILEILNEVDGKNNVRINYAMGGARSVARSWFGNDITGIRKRIPTHLDNNYMEVINDLFTGWHIGNVDKLREARGSILRAIQKRKDRERLWSGIRESRSFPFGQFYRGGSSSERYEGLLESFLNDKEMLEKERMIKDKEKLMKIIEGIEKAHRVPDFEKTKRIWLKRRK